MPLSIEEVYDIIEHVVARRVREGWNEEDVRSVLEPLLWRPERFEDRGAAYNYMVLRSQDALRSPWRRNQSLDEPVGDGLVRHEVIPAPSCDTDDLLRQVAEIAMPVRDAIELYLTPLQRAAVLAPLENLQMKTIAKQRGISDAAAVQARKRGVKRLGEAYAQVKRVVIDYRPDELEDDLLRRRITISKDDGSDSDD